MNLTEACVTLNVGRSGYHAHLRKHQRPRRRQDAQLATEIRALLKAAIEKSRAKVEEERKKSRS
jgi:hypothetical protein